MLLSITAGFAKTRGDFYYGLYKKTGDLWVQKLSEKNGGAVYPKYKCNPGSKWQRQK